MAEKRVIDWEGVEHDYRANTLTLREQAKKHGISVAYIRKKAAADSWDKDLNAKIQARAEALVHKAECTDSAQKSERALIESNALAIANIKLEHRGDIKKTREILSKMIAELETSTDELKIRLGCAKLLGDTLKVLVSLEREAWGITSAEDPEDKDIPAPRDDMEFARRIAFALTSRTQGLTNAEQAH